MRKTSDINVHNPRVEKLEDYAYMEAGKVGGDLSNFKLNLDKIFTGDLLDRESHKPLSASEKEKIKSQIEQKQKSNVEIKSDIEELEKDLVKNVDRTTELKDTLHNYETGGLTEGGLNSEIEIFSPPKFIVTSLFLIMLSIFIFLFYVAVVYKAIFINTQDIATSMTNGDWGVSLLPKWDEIQEALYNNKMVIFAPFVFFAFGYVLHLFLEMKSKLKYLYIILILGITFLLDFLLANQIHDRINDALDLIGMDPTNKFEDILLVLIMGFVVYIVWSIIFHSWFNELTKRNIPNRLGKLIRNLKEEKSSLQKSIGDKQKEVRSQDESIRSLTQSLSGESIPVSKIVDSLSKFTLGWMKYLTGLPEDLKDDKIAEIENYLQRYKTEKNLENFKINIR